MVTYGEWTQRPNYTVQDSLVAGSGAEAFDLAHATVTTESGWQDPAYSLTAEDLEAIMTSAYAASDNSGVVPPNIYGAGYEWDYLLSFPQWNTRWAGWRTLRRFTIQSRTHSYLPNPRPVGAIGVEYEGQSYDPEFPFRFGSAEVVTFEIAPLTSLAGLWEDTSNPGATNALDVLTTVLIRPATLSAPTLTAATVPALTDDGLGLANSPALQERRLPSPIDLTEFLPAEPGPVVQVWTRPAQGFVSPVGDYGEVGSQARVNYGWGIERLWTEWVLRPPLFRWVFDAEEPPPSYRRIHPRDALGTASARRNYPPSKSVAYGNRTGGGYL